jgi:hypothetical protein
MAKVGITERAAKHEVDSLPARLAVDSSLKPLFPAALSSCWPTKHTFNPL